MAFCSNCGNKLIDGAMFCDNCGNKIDNSGSSKKQREMVYDGVVHKCPNCGEVLNSFVSSCPSCSYEIRGSKNSNAVENFSKQINDCSSINKMIAIIRTFPVPNTKEDLYEFLLIAKSNVLRSDRDGDGKYSSSEHELLNAWLSKIDQCKDKGKLIFKNENDVKIIEDICGLIEEKIHIIEKSIKKESDIKYCEEKRKKFFKDKFALIVMGIPLFLSLITLMLVGALDTPNYVSTIFSILCIISLLAALLFGAHYIKFKNILFFILSVILSYTFSIVALANYSINFNGLVDNPNAIKIDYGKDDLKILKYDDVIEILESQGFTNIKSYEVELDEYDHEDVGEIKSISIDGSVFFSEGDYFLPEDLVVIYYYVDNE